MCALGTSTLLGRGRAEASAGLLLWFPGSSSKVVSPPTSRPAPRPLLCPEPWSAACRFLPLCSSLLAPSGPARPVSQSPQSTLSRGTAFSSIKLLHSHLHEAARPQVPCPFTATEASGKREQVCCRAASGLLQVP